MNNNKTQTNKMPSMATLIRVSIIISIAFIIIANFFTPAKTKNLNEQPGFENITVKEAKAWNNEEIKKLIESSKQTTIIENKSKESNILDEALQNAIEHSKKDTTIESNNSKDNSKDSVPNNDSDKELSKAITVQAQEAIAVNSNDSNKDSMTKSETKSETKSRLFKLYSGEHVPGSVLIEKGKSNPNALKLWQAFADRFGADIADIAIISLYYENSSYDTTTVGVCNPIHQINGNYKNCVYADLNTHGMDVGLKQINTFYQAERITKLGGEACNFVDSKDRKDPCNQKKIAWLLDIDNNIKISLDIYAEQGFMPWYGYRKGFL